MIEDVKIALRIASNAYDSEITDLIAACRADLQLAGIIPDKANADTDPLIKRCIITYVKAEFGYDNAESEKYKASYEMLKRHLMLSNEYTVSEQT